VTEEDREQLARVEAIAVELFAMVDRVKTSDTPTQTALTDIVAPVPDDNSWAENLPEGF
jgi:hypothetical protein